ncbi:hypothetical protein D9619_007708 [Psilocybe cf. subviscida]|uniref:Uncharacterized protein n=1 Tax=Psilocybe cf. subviscida TaxID=2480587 RepID=A0A8H5ATN1_9AGAR|nr:hypothetical protein D9619_007708 [Psilocybe cf. subviscida]
MPTDHTSSHTVADLGASDTAKFLTKYMTYQRE